MSRLLALLANLFPLWVLLASLLALYEPAWISWFGPRFIVWGLALIMLGMGLTLSVSDFKQALRMPRAVAIGVAAQFLLMPLWGWSIGILLDLPRDFAVGLILVACCPGGTASNVVTYIARANVALSVLMTLCSTAAAVVLTPLLTSWLAGRYIPVDAAGLFKSMVTLVLMPVALGVLLHHRLPRLARAIIPAGPLVSVALIALICASIIGARREAVLDSGAQLLLAVSLLHLVAFASGYLVARLAGFDPASRRAISIEVGMQNSGLATTLALRHFAATPLTAVPSAISSVMHSVIGSAFAGLWRARADRSETAPSESSSRPSGR